MDSIDVPIPPASLRFIQTMAKKAEIGGASQIRGDERMATLAMDQLIGQICTYAFNKYWFGDVRWWMIDRYYRNQIPGLGDNGHDIPGLNVDVKGSLIRNGNSLESYHLAVRPRERHAGWVYVLALAKQPASEAEPWIVHLLGWARDDELPAQPEAEGTFKGAFVLRANRLRPFPPLTWKFS